MFDVGARVLDWTAVDLESKSICSILVAVVGVVHDAILRLLIVVAALLSSYYTLQPSHVCAMELGGKFEKQSRDGIFSHFTSHHSVSVNVTAHVDACMHPSINATDVLLLGNTKPRLHNTPPQ